MKNRLNSICSAVLIGLVTAGVPIVRGAHLPARTLPRVAFILTSSAVVVAQQAADPAEATQRQDGVAPGETDTAPLIPNERVTWHVPDPDLDRQLVLERLEEARRNNDIAVVTQITRVLERTDTIRRPKQVRFTLEDVVRRTLANNYTIQTVSYNPAIETTRVVEAQAAFDALFFTSIQRVNVDQPSASELSPTDREFFALNTGIRKLLPSGAQVSWEYQLSRQKLVDFAFQLINPEYDSNIVLEMRQPLMRNFGIDFNRSLILITKNDRRISDLAFRRQVRDILREVEERYWRLVQARRDIVITARVLGEFEVIYEYLVARREFDITPVQIAATKARLEQARADFVVRGANVLNAEDRLIALMNDPQINLADDVELIPNDFPVLERVIVDRLAEAQTALDNRTELKEQQLVVKNAKIAVGRAKNAELPRFDLTFRTTYHGLAGTADASFDQATGSNFITYFIGVDIELPVGNRARRSSRRRAELQHSQAIAQLREAFEAVVLDVNLAVRRLETSYDQIAPTFESVEAREREVQSIVARAERKDFNTLINELEARQGPRGLDTGRRAMLSAIIEYNIAIINLERAKGTLLEYNNIVIPTEAD